MNNYDPYKGFMKGNIFDNLYNPYKNHQYIEINPTSDRQYLMLMVQTYSFNMLDLQLYLDNHPTDTNMINLYNEYLKLYKQSLNEYESRYGPITITSDALKTSPWAWDNMPWPWEVKANV